VPPESSPYELAFVLGGGGVLGAHEVGMLRALAERGVRPDVVLGTSVGAINGAFYAADPTLEGVERLTELWRESHWSDLSAGAALRRLTTLARSGTHLESLTELRERLVALLPVQRVEELQVPFQCVAASIERAAEHRFDRGPLADVVLASCAVPGILPPVSIDGEHFIDGGIVNSIPVSRAVALGARKIYVAPGRTPRAAAQTAAPTLGGRPGRVRGGAPSPLRARSALAPRRRRASRPPHRRLGRTGLQRPHRPVARPADDPHRPAADRLGL
jgi:NTE family protein